MTDVLGVAVLHCRNDLSHDFGSIALRQMLLFCDVKEQFTARAKLSDEKTYSSGLPSLVKFDDVRMILLLESLLAL